jgi:flagella basal body P-ring formation protein FlgA
MVLSASAVRKRRRPVEKAALRPAGLIEELRFLWAAIGMSLVVCRPALLAFAQPSDGNQSESAAESTPVADFKSALIAQIKAGLLPLIPPGMRLQGVDLSCSPPSGATLLAVAPGSSEITSRNVVVEIEANSRRLICGATITAQREVVAATRDFAPGDPITSDGLREDWVDAFSVSNGVLTALPSRELVADTAIRAGRPVYQAELARPLAVHPGDLVTVVIENGPVTLRTELEARACAAIGDAAPLFNPTTGTLVNATVTGDKTATLVLQ